MTSKLLREFSSFSRRFYQVNLTKMKMERTLASNASRSKETFGTIKELYDALASVMGVERGYRPIQASRAYLQKYLPKTQDELPTRSMKDSFLVALIPLSTDVDLQNKYISFLGHVRVERLLEDMDIFAVMVAQKHILNPTLPKDVPSPQTLVTALVDRIDFTDFVPKLESDIKISGHVSWVGKSSMEIVVWLDQSMQGSWQRITRAVFVIAARDPSNTSSAIVNALVPGDDREKEILSGGLTRKRNRMDLIKKHVTKVIPDQEEQKIVHDLYLKNTSGDDLSFTKHSLAPGCDWMENWTLSNIVFSHPENRNLHNTVFGGFIMRQAAELSWVLGHKFCKYRPKIKSISDINFSKPISVSSLIQMHSVVVFTQMQFMQIIVFVETLDPNTGHNHTTNTFHFTYEAPQMVPQVIPRTYHEAMMYIDGRRHFLEIMQREPTGFNLTLNEDDVANMSKL